MDEKRLTELVRSSGCNAKLPPGDLHEVLDSLPHDVDARLIGGYEKSDDAFVYDIGDGKVLIETVDFFPPMVDDPVAFGEHRYGYRWQGERMDELRSRFR